MRSIDHYVLVADNLSSARERYQRMGFTVAPNGVHPFGTYNANMYFRSGPMIETLAVEDAVKYSQAIQDGNTFVKNDAAFRDRHGHDGFSHIVTTSLDADKDHSDYLALGVSGGDLVSFTRRFEKPDGTLDTVSAKLAFATHPKALSGYFFTCEDVIVPKIDRSSLLEHENTTLGARQVLSCTRNPEIYRDFYHTLFGLTEASSGHETIECQLENGRVSLQTPDQIASEYGIEQTLSDTELRHRGLIFGVDNLGAVENLFNRNQVGFNRHKDRLIVAHHSQWGAFFGFEPA